MNFSTVSVPQISSCRKIAITVRRDKPYEAGVEETPRERNSDPLGPEFCVGYREVHSEA